MSEVSQSFIEVDSIWSLANDVTHPEYTIPDTVLWHVVRSLHLDEPHQLGIDPMCGNGTNVAFINEAGGNCYGIEIDESIYEIARDAMAQIEPFDLPGWVIGQAPQIVLGDCSNVVVRDKGGVPLPTRYIYTSIPFRELLDGTLGEHIVRAFSRLLLPPGSLSFMIIDSADEAVRDGATINPAAATVEYVERSRQFVLLDKVAFRVTNAPPGCDNQFTELMFVRRSELDSWMKIAPKPLSSS